MATKHDVVAVQCAATVRVDSTRHRLRLTAVHPPRHVLHHTMQSYTASAQRQRTTCKRSILLLRRRHRRRPGRHARATASEHACRSSANTTYATHPSRQASDGRHTTKPRTMQSANCMNHSCKAEIKRLNNSCVTSPWLLWLPTMADM